MGWDRRKAWSLVKEESVFVDWQRVKVQENSDEVRPRTVSQLSSLVWGGACRCQLVCGMTGPAVRCAPISAEAAAQE